MKKLVVLTGAGISAESGIKTFRDVDGLWEGHNVMDVASPEGWHRNKELVLDFYNQRRTAALNAKPNAAHYGLAYLEQFYEVTIITQNVDDLHERAGSSSVVHLHGSLFEKRSEQNEHNIEPIFEDMKVGALASDGALYRPNIVWFGEEVPEMNTAIKLVQKAEILIIVGTSMQVYPAASLVQFVSPSVKIFFIDPKPAVNSTERIKVYAEKATTGIAKAIEFIKNIK